MIPESSLEVIENTREKRLSFTKTFALIKYYIYITYIMSRIMYFFKLLVIKKKLITFSYALHHIS